MRIFPLLDAATATGPGQVAAAAAHADPLVVRTYQVSGKTTTGAGAAVVDIEVSNNGRVWLTLVTITLTLGTDEVTDGFASGAQWRFARANVTSISGTGASVTAEMGA